MRAEVVEDSYFLYVEVACCPYGMGDHHAENSNATETVYIKKTARGKISLICLPRCLRHSPLKSEFNTVPWELSY